MRRPSGNGGGSPALLPMVSGDDGFGGAGMEEEVDEDVVMCGGGGAGQRKRRLSVEQVRALERSFEKENKLEPELKARLARDLGLQPRQVAVWFQNRRARWKTKQLEQDFDHLKAAYDALAADHHGLLSDNDRLRAQVISLTDKLHSKETLPPATAYATTQEVDQPDCTASMVVTPPAQKLKEDILNSNGGGSPVVIDVAEGTNQSGESAYFAGVAGYTDCAGQYGGGGGALSADEEDGGAVSDEGCNFHLTDAIFAAAGVGHRATEEEEAQIRSWASWFWND